MGRGYRGTRTCSPASSYHGYMETTDSACACCAKSQLRSSRVQKLLLQACEDPEGCPRSSARNSSSSWASAASSAASAAERAASAFVRAETASL